MRKRLPSHLRGVNTADPCIEDKNPAYVLYEITEDHPELASLRTSEFCKSCQSATGRSDPGAPRSIQTADSRSTTDAKGPLPTCVMIDLQEASFEVTGNQYRASVIHGHRACVKHALASVALSDAQRLALQAVSGRIGLQGEPVSPDVIGMERDPKPLPLGPPPPIGAGELTGVRRSGEFVQAQPWLAPSLDLLIEWELRSIGRRPVRQLRVARGASLEELWKPLCTWAAPLRRDHPGRFRLARRAAEFLLGAYPWDALWAEGKSDLPAEVRVAIERHPKVILDYPIDTGCNCHACVDSREEVAAAKATFTAKYGRS